MSKNSILETVDKTFVVSGVGSNDAEAITVAFNKMKASAYKNHNNLIISLQTNDVRDVTDLQEDNSKKTGLIKRNKVTLEIDTTISYISRKEE